MNNKGQVLILFVLIIPILVLGAVYIVDNIYIAYNTNKLNQINSLVIKDISTNKLSIDEIEEYVKKNDNNIEVQFVLLSSNKVEITLKKNMKSLFGSIIGNNDYTLTSKKSVDIAEEVPLYQ